MSVVAGNDVPIHKTIVSIVLSSLENLQSSALYS